MPEEKDEGPVIIPLKDEGSLKDEELSVQTQETTGAGVQTLGS